MNVFSVLGRNLTLVINFQGKKFHSCHVLRNLEEIDFSRIGSLAIVLHPLVHVYIYTYDNIEFILTTSCTLQMNVDEKQSNINTYFNFLKFRFNIKKGELNDIIVSLII